MKNKEGWDGKMRMEPKAVITNPEALEDSDYSDPDAPPVEEIEADEDLLADEDVNAEDIDLVHCRISSISALKLERFPKLQVHTLNGRGIRMCLVTERGIWYHFFLKAQKRNDAAFLSDHPDG
ncbi:unnamed protein product [Penicillium crustosum]